LKSNEAIAIYETTDDDIVFGNALLKKTLFGWRVDFTVPMVNRNQFRLQTKKIIWGSYTLWLQSKRNQNTSIVNGKIFDPDIKEVWISTTDDKKYKATIIEGKRGEQLWFLIMESNAIHDATILGLSEDGELVYKE
jgi:hypothetical protein